MTIKKLFFGKRSAKGFTLVEIIVVLVILAILAAATIPSMLGFVNDAKQKSLTSEVRAVYTAAQAYATERLAEGKSDEFIMSKINGEVNSEHGLYYLLKNDATGKISKTKVEGGKVKSFRYVKNDVAVNYSGASGVQFGDLVATFDTGKNVNEKMKALAGDGSATYESEDNSIQGILRSSTLPQNLDKNDDSHVFSVNDSDCPIYAWYDNGIIYYYAENDNVSLNEDSSFMFNMCKSLNDITGLEVLDASNIVTMENMFADCAALSDSNITPLSAWDTSSVTSLAGTFFRCVSLNSVSSLSNWNVSSVTTLQSTFSRCSVLADITGLSNWDTSSVTRMLSVFFNCSSLSDITPLRNWNTSEVTTVEKMFYGCSPLSDATSLSNWDTDKVTRKGNTFTGTSVTDDKRPSWY